MKHCITLAAMLCAAVCAHAAMNKETYVFDVVDGDTLRLDRYYDPAAVRSTEARPVVLFAFGGGFRSGERDNPEYMPFFEFLTSQGIDVVSTDYRTSLAGITSINSPAMFAGALGMAITDAVSDYLQAAGFVNANARAWGVDSDRIIACGTIAGAITALQAEYQLTQMPQAPFRFAGVMSFAGAICSAGEPTWETTPCPMLLFHGDADRQVPYDRISVEGVGLYGSRAVAATLTEAGVPHVFYTEAGKGHEVATTPMNEHRYVILGFIRRYVCGTDNSTVNARQTFPDTPAGYQTEFSLSDYIRANM